MAESLFVRLYRETGRSLHDASSGDWLWKGRNATWT